MQSRATDNPSESHIVMPKYTSTYVNKHYENDKGK